MDSDYIVFNYLFDPIDYPITMSQLNNPHVTIIYDSRSPYQQILYDQLKEVGQQILEIETNACPLSEKMLISIMEKLNTNPSRVLINKKSPWYRCFAEDFNEMNEFVLLRTIKEFPSLLNTPIIVMKGRVFVSPKIEELPIEQEIIGV